MASIGSDPNGLKRILFVDGDGSRKTIRLGKATVKQAEAFKVKVEALVTAVITGNLDDETARWLVNLDDRMHGRLVAVGLAKPRSNNSATLKVLLDGFFQHLNVKPITSLGYQSTRTALLEFFGAETPIREIQPLQADEWRRKLKSDGLAEATISKRIKLARQIFRQAIRWKMTAENPFADVRAGSQMNKSRQRFITPEEAEKVLQACPDVQWRLLFALSRYGGLRCPSEHLNLTWSDIDWERDRFRVTCSKTERHEGRGERFVPIFPELRPYLLEAHEQAEPGISYVITRYRDRNANLRTQLQRIIRKAGLTAWPRLFHNLRSSRQTELAEQFPAQVVCAWIGNTERVAQDHYLQVTDAHFEAAVRPRRVKPQAAQNPAQYPAESTLPEQKSASARKQNHPDFPRDSEVYDSLREREIAPTGLEPVTRGL